MRVSTSFRVDAQSKEVATEVFRQYGMSLSDGVNLFLHQVALTHGIPFEIKVPSDRMEKALKELEEGKGERFENFEALKADLPPCLS